jgi:hypothetical protein
MIEDDDLIEKYVSGQIDVLTSESFRTEFRDSIVTLMGKRDNKIYAKVTHGKLPIKASVRKDSRYSQYIEDAFLKKDFVQERSDSSSSTTELTLYRTENCTIRQSLPVEVWKEWRKRSNNKKFFLSVNTTLYKIVKIEPGEYEVTFTLQDYPHRELYAVKEDKLIWAEEDIDQESSANPGANSSSQSQTSSTQISSKAIESIVNNLFDQKNAGITLRIDTLTTRIANCETSIKQIQKHLEADYAKKDKHNAQIREKIKGIELDAANMRSLVESNEVERQKRALEKYHNMLENLDVGTEPEDQTGFLIDQ